MAATSVAFILRTSDWLRFFTQYRDVDGWEETATSWVLAAIVVAVIGAGIVFAYKAVRKQAARTIVERTWSRGETVLLILMGLLPVLFLTFGIWYLSRDFTNIVGLWGLIKGIVFAWLLYLVLMLVGHAVSPWRRELL